MLPPPGANKGVQRPERLGCGRARRFDGRTFAGPERGRSRPVNWQMITCADVDRAVRRVAWLLPVLASQALPQRISSERLRARSRRVVVRESWFAVAVCGGPWDARSVSQVITAPPCAPVHTRSAMATANARSVQPTPASASALARSAAVPSCSRSRSGSRSRMTRTSASASATGAGVRVAVSGRRRSSSSDRRRRASPLVVVLSWLLVLFLDAQDPAHGYAQDPAHGCPA